MFVATGVAFVGLLAVVGLQHRTIQSKSEQIGRAQAGKAEALRLAEANESAAVELAQRLRDEVQRNALDAAAMERANEALEAELDRIRQDISEERRVRDEIYQADQDCATWRAAPVCAAIADRLRHGD